MLQRLIFDPSQFLILAVDDVPLNLKVLRAILEPSGYAVTYAAAGAQAIARAQSARPDLILLDLMMPDIDGLQVCRTLSADPLLADIPIIFLTASTETEDIVQAFDQGAVDYITKPFNKPELLARIRTHLELKVLRAQALQQIQHEKLLHHLLASMHQSLQLEDVLLTTVTQLRSALQADQGLIYQFQAAASPRLWAQIEAEPIASPARPNLAAIAPATLAIAALHTLTADAPPAVMYQTAFSPWQPRQVITIPIGPPDQPWGGLILHQATRASPWSTTEVDLLQQVGQHLELAIQRSELYHQLQEANAALFRLSHLDDLTQIANRRQFDLSLEVEWRRAQREQQPLALILGDIDYFKQYNDAYGHPSGDDCLRQVALILQQTIKRPADVVARYGGEEFALILPHTDRTGAQQLVELIQQAIAAQAIPHRRSPIAAELTFSFGIVSLIPTPGQSPEQLLRRTDQALYQAKAQGRHQAVTLTMATPNCAAEESPERSR